MKLHNPQPSGVGVARALIGTGALMVLAVAFLLALLGSFAAQTTWAQDSNEGDVIVQYGPQAQVVRTIRFTGSISGLTALELTGLRVVTASTGFGPAVCSIEGVGCPTTDCFCHANRFWSYNFWDGSTWQSYPTGASSSIISRTGAVEGWRWGAFGDPQSDATAALAAARAVEWLAAHQSETDGSYGSAGATVETMLAAGANHMDAAVWRRAPGQPSLVDFIAGSRPGYSRGGAAAAGKLAVALAAANACQPAGTLTPSAYYSSTAGAYSPQSGANVWAILGALAIGEEVPGTALQALRSQTAPGGGWERAPGWGADTNTTALAIQALIAGGEPLSSSVVISGLAFLRSMQNEDGGFPYVPSTGAPAASDADSTAYVVQVLAAVGEDPLSPQWSIGSATPIRYLLGMQLPDKSFEWQPQTGTNLLATQQAIAALLGQAYPMRIASLDPCPAVYLPTVQRP